VAHTADVVARGLSGNRYPQTGQYAAAQEVTGQVLPPAPASSAPAAPDASCEVHVAYDGRCTRSGQIAVRVSLAFPGGGEGTVDIAPGGGSEDSEAPPPGTGNPYFHDVFFFAPLGATVTLTASPKGGSRWNGWNPIATEHNQGCPQTGPGSPTTCSVTLPETWTARIGYDITAVPDFAKSP